MILFSNIFSFFYTLHIKRVEKELGYHIEFEKIPKTWINGLMTFDMRKSWLKRGINAKGINYFTVGALYKGVSSRFIRSKKQYQSWLGAYLVKFGKKEKHSLQDYYNLAIADQKNWLNDFGDLRPRIKMPSSNTARTKKIRIGKYTAKLHKFLGGPSQSDVGKRSGNFRNRTVMGLMAAMFNKSNPKLNLKGSNFIPQNITKTYETVTLKGYIAVVDLGKNTKLVLYGNGAVIKNNGGKKIDYYKLIRKDILDAFRSVKIREV